MDPLTPDDYATKYTGYASVANRAGKEAVVGKIKIDNGNWHNSLVKSTRSGLKTWKQVNGDVKRFKTVKEAKQVDEFLNGTGKVTDGLKGVGVLGGAGALLDGATTYLDRKKKYGNTSAAIDGVAHTASSVGAIYAGAAIGSAIPIPVVGTVAGAVSGYVIGGAIGTVYDGVAHGTWNLDNFELW